MDDAGGWAEVAAIEKQLAAAERLAEAVRFALEHFADDPAAFEAWLGMNVALAEWKNATCVPSA